MNRLRQTRCYLCGAMDRVKDGGEGWRKNTRKVNDHQGIIWLDPTRKPIDIGTEDMASRARRRKYKASGKLYAVTKEIKPIRHVDLRMVDISDFLVVNLDMDIHACGTYEEIFLANRQKKPILIHVEQGRNAVPDWLLGTVPEEHIFDSWSDLHDYMDKVNSDPDWCDHYGRWYFFDWTGPAGDQPVHLYQPKKPSKIKTFLKSLVWELISLVLTFIVSWLVTGNVEQATEMTAILFALKTMGLFVYDLIWQRRS